MNDGMPIRVTPKAVIETEPAAGHQGEDDRERADRRQIGDVHVIGLQREEGQHDRRRIGDGGDAEVDLGGQNDEGQADRDDRGDRDLLQNVFEIAERGERRARHAEEDDEEQQRANGAMLRI